MLFFVLSLALTISMSSCGGHSSSTSTTSSTSNVSQYKSVYTALNDGSIYYGMTYNQIVEICGPATRVSRSNGVVKYAYYGNVQLCFHGSSGGFTNWND